MFKQGLSFLMYIYPSSFKDQSWNAVRRQFNDLSNKIGPILQPVFVSRKLEHDLKPGKLSRRL